MKIPMRGTEVFRAGVHKGKPYTTADLDDMVTNFNRFQSGPQKLQKAPVVIGHSQKDIDNSAVAKHGDVTKLYRDGDILKLDTDPLDEGLVNAIRANHYDDVSAEIYDEPPAGIKEHGARGKMFRRLTILGGDIPYVKGLNQRGLAACMAFRESPRVRVTRVERRGAAYQTFSEESAMTREELIAELVAAGGNAEVIDTFSDEQLAETVKFRATAPAAAQTPVNVPVAVTFSEADVKAAVAELVKTANDRITEALDTNTKALKRQTVDLFCEAELQAGRIDPADMDRSKGPNLADRLIELDDVEKIHTFTEGGTARSLTRLEADMRAIRLRKPRYDRNGSKIAAGTSGPATFAESGKSVTKDRFTAFAEEHAEEFSKTGQTVTEVVEAWELATPALKRELESALGFAG